MSKISFSPQRVQNVDLPTRAMVDCLAKFHDMEPFDSDLNPERLRGQTWTADTFGLANIQNAAAVVERSRHKAETSAHLLAIQRYTSGRVHGFLGDLNVDRMPGNIYIFDMESRVKCIQYPVALQCVYIPKSAIGYKSGTHPPLMTFAAHTTMGALLESQFTTIFGQISATDEFDKIAFDQLIALLKVAIDSEDQDQSSRRLAQDSLRKMIQSHIETHLDSPTLSLSSILQNYGTSRASLFRMFEAYGGVRRYINDRRLYRAVLDISQRPLVRGAISDAAEKWGFSSNANFNRAVKRTFGAAPSSLINPKFLEERSAA